MAYDKLWNISAECYQKCVWLSVTKPITHYLMNNLNYLASVSAEGQPFDACLISVIMISYLNFLWISPISTTSGEIAERQIQIKLL